MIFVPLNCLAVAAFGTLGAVSLADAVPGAEVLATVAGVAVEAGAAWAGGAVAGLVTGAAVAGPAAAVGAAAPPPPPPQAASRLALLTLNAPARNARRPNGRCGRNWTIMPVPFPRTGVEPVPYVPQSASEHMWGRLSTPLGPARLTACIWKIRLRRSARYH